MAENISAEIFEESELTVNCTVPLYWNDADAWNDGDPLPGTTIIRAQFEEPYKRLDLGEAGQDSSEPMIRFLSARIPYAREGDEIVVDREVLQVDGTILVVPTTYRVGTVQPNGYGITDCLLYET